MLVVLTPPYVVRCIAEKLDMGLGLAPLLPRSAPPAVTLPTLPPHRLEAALLPRVTYFNDLIVTHRDEAYMER